MRIYYPEYLISLLLLALALVARAEVEVPPLQARVTDLTGTLTDQQKAYLESMLADFEKQKGSQVVVLIVPTTQPETIEEYGIRVADEWKIGREGVDDGVILLVAKDDRRVRIEVGYGLEGAIPDAYAKRIIENIIIPKFRQGRFYEGISDGLGAIMSLIEGEELPEVTSAASSDKQGDKWVSYFIFAIFGLSFLSAFIKNKKVKLAILLIFAGIIFLVTWKIVFSIMAVIFGLPVMFGRGRGGVYYGGGFSGGGGGGSFGGGGFSGGGGGFGGGGASGSW